MEVKGFKRAQITPRTNEKLQNCKRTKKQNLASMLVTQVHKGQARSNMSPFASPTTTSLKTNIVLGEQKINDIGKKTLVLDLDETLVHSSFQPTGSYDLLLPVEIEGQTCYVYVLKRPGVDLFLEKLAEIYELVIYTASLSKYADPLLDWLDPKGLCSYRLFREHCTFYNGIYVKDLSRLARNLKDTIIIDNSPPSYLMHPE
jgi:RNA polymerase II subunit A small phosphatase-like protein